MIWQAAAAAFACGLLLGAFAAAYYFRKNPSVLPVSASGQETLIAELRRQGTEQDRVIRELREQSESLRRTAAVAETRLEEAQKNIESQRVLLDEAQLKLTTTFQALAGEALKSNSSVFAEQARKTLDAVLAEARGDLGKKEESIRGAVRPLEEALQRYEAGIKELESKRASAYGSLENQIQSMIASQQLLQREAGNLVTALRRPEVRGRYGEVTLKRVAELAGMSEHCDFTEQASTETEEGRIRPDMIVHLPAGRDIVIDSKISLDAYLDAIAADSDEKRKEHFARHAQQIRKHMNALAGKNYWDQFDKAPEFTVMFIPGEAFLSAALESDHTLVEDGMENKVILATPTTLIALLRAIAYGWRQEQVAKNAEMIADLGRQLHDRFGTFVDHLEKTRGSIEQSVFNFNRMLGSFEGRILPAVRKFRELGAVGGDEIPSLTPIEQVPRNLAAARPDPIKLSQEKA